MVINATATTAPAGTKQPLSFKVKGGGRNKIPSFDMEGGSSISAASFGHNNQIGPRGEGGAHVRTMMAMATMREPVPKIHNNAIGEGAARLSHQQER